MRGLTTWLRPTFTVCHVCVVRFGSLHSAGWPNAIGPGSEANLDMMLLPVGSLYGMRRVCFSTAKRFEPPESSTGARYLCLYFFPQCYVNCLNLGDSIVEEQQVSRHYARGGIKKLFSPHLRSSKITSTPFCCSL